MLIKIDGVSYRLVRADGKNPPKSEKPAKNKYSSFERGLERAEKAAESGSSPSDVNAQTAAVVSAVQHLEQTVRELNLQLSIGDDVILQSLVRADRDHAAKTGKPLFEF